MTDRRTDRRTDNQGKKQYVSALSEVWRGGGGGWCGEVKRHNYVYTHLNARILQYLDTCLIVYNSLNGYKIVPEGFRNLLAYQTNLMFDIGICISAIQRQW